MHPLLPPSILDVSLLQICRVYFPCLAVAIPAIAAYNLLRNRVTRLLLEVGVTSENLMSRFEDVQPQGAKK